MLTWVVEPRTWQWHVETAWIAGQVPRGPRSDHRRIVNQQATTAFACILAACVRVCASGRRHPAGHHACMPDTPKTPPPPPPPQQASRCGSETRAATTAATPNPADNEPLDNIYGSGTCRTRLLFPGLRRFVDRCIACLVWVEAAGSTGGANVYM